MGWTTLRQRVADYPDIVKKYFPDFAPVDVVGAIESGFETTSALFREQFTSLQAVIERGDANDLLRTRILDAAKLIEGALGAGLKALERLCSGEAAAATARNRYLLRANIGFARFMMGEQAVGVLELRAAAAEDPTWPQGPLGARLALNFNVTDPRDAQVRVAFDPDDGNWSYVGKTNGAIKSPPKTMNIANVVNYVIQHEFGHACGLQHEHQFSGFIQ